MRWGRHLWEDACGQTLIKADCGEKLHEVALVGKPSRIVPSWEKERKVRRANSAQNASVYPEKFWWDRPLREPGVDYKEEHERRVAGELPAKPQRIFPIFDGQDLSGSSAITPTEIFRFGRLRNLKLPRVADDLPVRSRTRGSKPFLLRRVWTSSIESNGNALVADKEPHRRRTRSRRVCASTIPVP